MLNLGQLAYRLNLWNAGNWSGTLVLVCRQKFAVLFLSGESELMERRDFLKLLAVTGVSSTVHSAFGFASGERKSLHQGAYAPGHIANEFSHYLPGEEEAIRTVPVASELHYESIVAKLGNQSTVLRPGQVIGGWRLLAIAEMNGVATAVFEKHVTHRGAIAYVTEQEGTIAWIPKYIGSVTRVRPRPTDTPHGIELTRAAHYAPGPDAAGEYLLNSSSDPCYENVAALGPEYTGWTLVANEHGGPEACIYLEPDGKSRELAGKPSGSGTWEPDEVGAYFDPANLLPGQDPQIYEYKSGFSKRTLLGGYLPVADTGVWNPQYECGYEVMLLLPPGADAQPIGRVRIMVPKDQSMRYASEAHLEPDADGRLYFDRYWNCSPQSFFSELAGIWNHWSSLYETAMPVSIPDEWLLNSARAGITLSRCSYRGLEPTYQIGEGAYTKIPERSHALFPVAEYEFVWAQQLWNLSDEADVYFQYYLDKYILPDGNFLYNTQDQVEAPLNAGIFLANSARSYDYNRNLESLRKRLAVLERMIQFVLKRYEYSKQAFAPGDRRYGLIYGSPEADLGDPDNDFPRSHPLYYQNSTWTWRGLVEHARCLALAGEASGDPTLKSSAVRYQSIAAEMRKNIQASLEATLGLRDPAMKAADIMPFTPDDITREPKKLSSYENHRFMEDWFLADWGVPELDLGHLLHRKVAGMQIMGLGTDGAQARTSNFMAHGTLSVNIRQQDYRPFLLSLYALVCYCADSGNRYSPEDAFIPGSYAGEGSKYGWSAVINSTLQPALGLRWLLCYEESDKDICHLQKAAPKHWFTSGETISVRKCPTRFGSISWSTHSVSNRQWEIKLDLTREFTGDLIIHIHPEDDKPIRTTSLGIISGNSIVLDRKLLANNSHFEITAT